MEPALDIMRTIGALGASTLADDNPEIQALIARVELHINQRKPFPEAILRELPNSETLTLNERRIKLLVETVSWHPMPAQAALALGLTEVKFCEKAPPDSIKRAPLVCFQRGKLQFVSWKQLTDACPPNRNLQEFLLEQTVAYLFQIHFKITVGKAVENHLKELFQDETLRATSLYSVALFTQKEAENPDSLLDDPTLQRLCTHTFQKVAIALSQCRLHSPKHLKFFSDLFQAPLSVWTSVSQAIDQAITSPSTLTNFIVFLQLTEGKLDGDTDAFCRALITHCQRGEKKD